VRIFEACKIRARRPSKNESASALIPSLHSCRQSQSESARGFAR
jgi:hypothetical protein